jgi:hypothetical protein
LERPVYNLGRKAQIATATQTAPVLADETSQDFQAMSIAYENEFRPESEHEAFLVTQMVEARWRMIRMDRLENRAFEQALERIEADPKANILEQLQATGADFFRRQRAAAEKSYYKAHKELTTGRDRTRKAASIEVRREAAEAERAILDYINAPMPVLRNEPNPPRPRAATPVPAALATAHRPLTTLPNFASSPSA